MSRLLSVANNTGVVTFSIDARVRLYLDKVIELSASECGNHLFSVVLFGSAVKGEYKEGVSDIDLMVVVSDETPKPVLEHLGSRLEGLEAASGPMRNRSHFLWVFASRTALFRSHFVVRRASLTALDTRKLFEEARGFNLPFGRLLLSIAPSDLVVQNVLRGAAVVYGENILEGVQLPRPGPSGLARSFLVSLVLSLFGGLASIFFADGSMFSLEAVKWFLLDLHSYSHDDSGGIREALSYAEKLSPSPVLQGFSVLRQSYHRSIAFSLACPLYLSYLFLVSFLKRPGKAF